MWRVLAVLAALVAVGAVLWLDRRPLLESAADHWIVSDQITLADAVAVLGGGIEDRPFAAAEYYRRGLVKKVLLSNVHVGPAENIGAMPSEVEATRDILLKLGVPSGAIETFGSDLSNTHEEALALRAWAERTGARSIIVPTEIFSARRVRWTLDRVFGNHVLIRVPALDPATYRCGDWWRHEEGVISFQNEVIKYIYYRIRY
jgi:uncharacterized SAM-binding protein YcdF (DUF218 family)